MVPRPHGDTPPAVGRPVAPKGRIRLRGLGATTPWQARMDIPEGHGEVASEAGMSGRKGHRCRAFSVGAIHESPLLGCAQSGMSAPVVAVLRLPRPCAKFDLLQGPQAPTIRRHRLMMCTPMPMSTKIPTRACTSIHLWNSTTSRVAPGMTIQG